MTSIIITRKEMTTYSVIIEVEDEKAMKFIESPEDYQAELEMLCPAKPCNWQDADEAEFEVEEDNGD